MKIKAEHLYIMLATTARINTTKLKVQNLSLCMVSRATKISVRKMKPQTLSFIHVGKVACDSVSEMNLTDLARCYQP
jgi:hypothetical protein